MPPTPQPNIKLKKFLTNVGQKVANGNAKLLFLTPIIRAVNAAVLAAILKPTQKEEAF